MAKTKPLILKPSQALRLTKAGRLPEVIKGGHPYCWKCHKQSTAGTEAPIFWENGMYCYCESCKTMTLHGGCYPPCEGYPEGVLIDTRGERKKYPLVLDKREV